MAGIIAAGGVPEAMGGAVVQPPSNEGVRQKCGGNDDPECPGELECLVAIGRIL